MKKLLFFLLLSSCTPQEPPAIPPYNGVVYHDAYGNIVPPPRLGAHNPDSHAWRGRQKIETQELKRDPIADRQYAPKLKW